MQSVHPVVYVPPGDFLQYISYKGTSMYKHKNARGNTKRGRQSHESKRRTDLDYQEIARVYDDTGCKQTDLMRRYKCCIKHITLAVTLYSKRYKRKLYGPSDKQYE